MLGTEVLAAPRRRRSTSGFTMVELLVVMSIVMILAVFLIAGLWPQKDKAFRSNTMAMIEAIKGALDQYYSEFHDFPPDGYDDEPAWIRAGNKTAGTVGLRLQIKPTDTPHTYFGSGCLIFFLCYPQFNTYSIGADQGTPDPRNIRQTACNKGAAFLSTLKRENFSTAALYQDFDPSVSPSNTTYPYGGTDGAQNWANGEILDAYGFPIHYDKVHDVPLNAADGNASTGKNGIWFQPGRFCGSPTGIHSDTAYYNQFVAGRVGLGVDVETSVCPTNGSAGAHIPGTGLTHADPRAAAQPDGCYIDNSNPPWSDPTAPRPRNPGGYDIWAHGKAWANGITAITNWK
jgi:type II secretory pathway pseudopilin PulG